MVGFGIPEIVHWNWELLFWTVKTPLSGEMISGGVAAKTE